jgi:hypothetical protein
VNVRRYAVIEVDAELLTATVTEGLTEDAVCSRLHKGGLAPPLFIHAPPQAAGLLDRRLSEATPEAEWERRVGAVFRGVVGGTVRYSDVDAVDGMLERVRRHLSLPPDAEFTVVSPNRGAAPAAVIRERAKWRSPHRILHRCAEPRRPPPCSAACACRSGAGRGSARARSTSPRPPT